MQTAAFTKYTRPRILIFKKKKKRDSYFQLSLSRYENDSHMGQRKIFSICVKAL